MKIRTDFVTNSSSSSFVIGTAGDRQTEDSIFQLMKKEYNKVKLMWNQYKEAIPKNVLENMDIWNRKYRYVYEQYERYLNANGIETEDYMDAENYMITEEDPKWMEFKTYKDMEEYYKNPKNKETMAFRIYDLTNPEILSDRYSIMELVDWYGFAYDARGKYIYTAGANESYGSKSDRAKNLGGFRVPKEAGQVCEMGHIYVASENGYIPACVVNMLYDVSNYACAHMG